MLDAVKEKKAKLWARDELDWYVEPTVATEALLGVERFVGRIFDPCCGAGNIPKTCIVQGYDAFGSDVVNRLGYAPAWWLGESDFMACIQSPYENIIMNPPFFRAKGAETFIRHALHVCRGKVAAFVDIRFIAGAERANGLFREHQPSRIWVVTPRVSCPPGAYLATGNKAGNGSSDWCWLVWDENRSAKSTEFCWLQRSAAKT